MACDSIMTRHIRFFFALAAAVTTALPLLGQYRTPSVQDLGDGETVSAFKDHISYLCSPELGGRAAGSEGEKSAARYVTNVLKSYDISILSDDGGDIFGIRQPDGDTLTSRNVIAFIPGSDRTLKERYIVIGARMDGSGTREMTINGDKVQVLLPGANAGASGVAMLLELGRRLSTSQLLLGRSVLLVAFGASTQTFAGSWYFLNRSFSDVAGIDAMIDLEAVGMGRSGLYAYTASNPDLNALIESVNSTLQPVKPEITSSQMFPSDQMAFYDKEIPSVMFTTGPYSEFQTQGDTPDIIQYDEMDKAMEYIFNFAVSLSSAPKPVFDVETALRDRKADTPATVPYYDCDRKPSFLGNTDPRVFLRKWVYQYLKYPESAVREGVQGRVLVDFVIDEKGKVTDVKVLKGADGRLDDEAVRVISASPDWKPGTVRGKPVRAEMSLWVEFRLEKKNKR